MTRIRPMAVADAGRIAELTTQLGYPSEAAEMERRFADVEARPHEAALVAVDAEDRAIGWIHVAMRALLEVSDQAEISGLVTDLEHRSSGIGTELVAAAEAWARARGATRMVVRSRSTRTRAHRFYEREGYVQVKLSHVFDKPLV